MMQCRMCSQRLTRPGKLCRECDRELGRARALAASVDTLSGAVPLIDASRMAAQAPTAGWMSRLRSRPAVLAAAFSVGLATAAGAYVAQRSHAASEPASVMLDGDLTHIKPRSFGTAAPAGVTSFRDVAAPSGTASDHPDKAVLVPASASVERPAPTTHASRTAGARTLAVAGDAGAARKTRVGAGGLRNVVSDMPEPVQTAAMTVAVAAPGRASATLDRVLALSTALESCAQESLFSRIACEYRARIRYCDGIAGRVPQCGGNDAPFDHGQ